MKRTIREYHSPDLTKLNAPFVSAPESGDTNLIALAESLQKPFDQESRQLKKDIARTFVPVVNRIKETFSSIEQTVEAPSAAGLLVFNDASREVENSIGLHDRMVQKAQTEYRVRNSSSFVC